MISFETDDCVEWNGNLYYFYRVSPADSRFAECFLDKSEYHITMEIPISELVAVDDPDDADSRRKGLLRTVGT